MKFVKGISLFFIYPLCMLGIGFYFGVEAVHFFYSGQSVEMTEEQTIVRQNTGNEVAGADTGRWDTGAGEQAQNQKLVADGGMEHGSGGFNNAGFSEDYRNEQYPEEDDLNAVEAVNANETLNADTEYVLEETDVLTQSVVVTVSGLPAKYIGMNRQQFLNAMEQYEVSPPLVELERGFISLEVLSFSKERVVVQMNYQYVQPSTSFYLAVQDNEVVVLLENKKTVFIYTGIRLEELPENIQTDIIQMRFVEDEEKLYNFLEAFSS